MDALACLGRKSKISLIFGVLSKDYNDFNIELLFNSCYEKILFLLLIRWIQSSENCIS